MTLTPLLSRIVTHYPKTILTIVTLITLCALVPLGDIGFFQEDIGELNPDDPEVAYFQKFQQEFGDDEFITVAIETEDVFTARVLRYLRALSQAAERLPEVDHTSSLVNVEDLSVDHGTLLATPFIDEIPDDPAELALLRERALGHRYWAGALVSSDATVASIQVVLRRDGKALPRVEATEGLRALLAESPPPDGITVHLAGRGPVIVDSKRYMMSDVKRFLWLTPVLIVLLLFYLFRSLRGIVIPLGVAGLAVLWTAGIFLATGAKVSLPITMLPTLISVICLSDTIHIMVHYYESASRNTDSRDALLQTTAYMIPTCLLTSISTAVGIGSLTLSGMHSLQQFAIWASVGIFVAYALSVSVVPAILALLPRPTETVHRRMEGGLIPIVMNATVKMVHERRWLGVALALGCALLTAGILRLQLDTRFAANIPSSAPSGIASKLLTEKLSGTSMVQIVLEGAPYAFEEPQILEHVAKLEHFLNTQPEINHVTSIVDLVAETHSQFSDDVTDRSEHGIPTDGRVITDYFVYLSQTELIDRMANQDRSKVVLFAAMNELGTSAQLALLSRADAFGAQELPPSITMHSTGTAKLFATTSHRLVTGQVRSLGFTFIILALLLIAVFRSWKLGLISMVPNAIPVILTLGAMGYLDIPLGTSTIMISCIAIGIAVDDTIHFLARYLVEAKRSDDPIGTTILSSGRAIVFTTLVFTGGFSIFAFSNFEPTRHFGLLTAFSMLTALVADILVLPLLLRWIGVAKAPVR